MCARGIDIFHIVKDGVVTHALERPTLNPESEMTSTSSKNVISYP